MSDPIPTLSKSCPFCGSAKLTIGYDGQPAIRFYVACLQCGAQGPPHPGGIAGGGPIPGERLADTWNTRANPSCWDDDPVIGPLIRETYETDPVNQPDNMR